MKKNAYSFQQAWLVGLCIVLAFNLTGCGSSNIQQPTFPASGQVMMDGKPVVGATVVLVPVDSTKFRWAEQPQGITDKEGNFKLFTYSSNDGAPAAEYKVGIVLFEEAAEDGGDQVKRDNSKVDLPKKYADPSLSGLTAKIEAKSTVLETFNLKSSGN